MSVFHVLTSNHIPEDHFIFEEVEENGRTLGMKIKCDVAHDLTQVDAFGSIEGVPITKKTRFVAFLERDGEYYDEAGYVDGLVGSPELYRGRVERIYGVDGSVIWESKDAYDYAKVIPPEMVGLEPFRWWKKLLN